MCAMRRVDERAPHWILEAESRALLPGLLDCASAASSIGSDRGELLEAGRVAERQGERRARQRRSESEITL